MRRKERHVKKERRLAVVCVDELDCLVTDEGRIITIFPEEGAVPLPVDDAAPVLREVIDLADDIAVEVIKAAFLRPVRHCPGQPSTAYWLDLADCLIVRRC
jgi:hypothetical protein